MCPTGTSIRPETSKTSVLRSAFEILDADRDGKISREDLKSFYLHGRISTSMLDADDELIGTMMSVADSNKNGYVEYDEFEKVLNGKGKSEKKGGVMEEVFMAMDRDGDGKVSYGDLRDYLTGAGMDVGDEDIKAMIRLGGGEENGGVTYENFRKILAV